MKPEGHLIRSPDRSPRRTRSRRRASIDHPSDEASAEP